MRASNNTEWLFHNLWKTNPETLIPFPCINIPETLIYRWGQPQSWYSTTKDGQIIQKTKDKFSPQNMEDAFANNLPKCEVIASAITSYDDPALKFQEKMEFEYIMKPDFHEFLAQPEKQHNIILQKFVEPKGGQNAVIKVSWTPQFCLLFRKTNINDINNQKIHLLNRLVTFEGYEHLSNSDSISSPVLATELEQTCLNIVKHIQAVTNGNVRILKITLYFKLDDKNRLWLLYCTGLKVRDKGRNSISGVLFKKKNERPLSPVMMVTTRKEREAHKNKIPLQYLHEEQVNQIGDKECFKCGQENLLFDMKLKNLLEYEEKILKSVRASFIKQAEESEIVEGPLFFGKLLTPEKVRSNVPAVMKKLYPTLTDDRYVKLKKNISLMNLSVKVCEACYLAVTENVLENSEEPSASRIQSQMMERIRRERDFFGYSSSPGNRRVSSRKSGSEKALRVMTFHAKAGMDTDSSPWSTDRETNQTKRLSTLDNLQRADEAQPEPKFGRPSAFFYMKSAQQERVKSAFSLKKADIPHIGIPEINDFKIADLNFASYSVATTKTNLFDQYDRTKTNVAPMRQARSPYANEMRPVSGLRKEFRSSDAIKKAVNVPRPPSKEKVSLETTWKNSVASIWKKDRSHLAHRTNYSSIMNTIKDLKSVLNESLGEIEAK